SLPCPPLHVKPVLARNVVLCRRLPVEVFLLLWCAIPNASMYSPPVVPAFDIFEQTKLGRSVIKIFYMVDLFGLEYGVKRFDTGIVIGTAFVTKRLPDAKGLCMFHEGIACIL